MESMKRAKPIAAVTAIWDKGSISRFPETVRVPMDNGIVVTYRIDMEKQPHPAFLSAMELLRKLPKGCYWHKKGRGL